MIKKLSIFRKPRLMKHMSYLVFPLSLITPFMATSQVSKPPSSIDECQSISNAALRLVCFDTLFSKDLPSPVIEPETQVVVPDTPSTTSEYFGKNVEENDLLRPVREPENKEAVKKAKAAEVTSLSEPVSKIDMFGYKKIRVTLENGQVWEQVGSVTRRLPKMPDRGVLTAEIRKGALNSYSLQFDGKGRAIKVRRVR